MMNPQPSNAPPATWRDHTFYAMGGNMAVWLDTADAQAAQAAFAGVEALFATYEQALSRFRPDSELSRLNARSGQWVVVSDLLWAVLAQALRMAAQTAGRFDPTLLAALQQSGYVESFRPAPMGTGPTAAGQLPLPEAESYPGQWAAIQLHPEKRAVRIPAGVQVDLGGIAKGFTAEKAVESLRAYGPCLVDAGGDLVAGDGPHGFPGWPVGVSAPWQGAGREPGDLFTAWLANQSLATSGIDYRAWTHNHRPVHHLIDPATGQPAATDGLTVTVMAAEAATAEAWATATLVAGSAAGMAALLDAGLAGFMVLQNHQILVTPPMHRAIQNGSFILAQGNH